MEFKEIAKELAVACLGHPDVAVYFRCESADVRSAKVAGERLGEFYNAILKALLKDISASSKSTS